MTHFSYCRKGNVLYCLRCIYKHSLTLLPKSVITNWVLSAAMVIFIQVLEDIFTVIVIRSISSLLISFAKEFVMCVVFTVLGLCSFNKSLTLLPNHYQDPGNFLLGTHCLHTSCSVSQYSSFKIFHDHHDAEKLILNNNISLLGAAKLSIKEGHWPIMIIAHSWESLASVYISKSNSKLGYAKTAL